MNDWNRMIVVYFKDGAFGLNNDDKVNKLRSFFEDMSLTNGGEIEKLNLNRNNTNQAFIYFKEKEVAERVAKQSNIEIGSYKFNVKLNNRKERQPGENTSRDPYEEFTNNDHNEKAAVAVDLSNRKTNSHLYRRPIIIDGNNVGMSHGRAKLFSCRGLQIAVDYFTELGHRDIVVIVPRKRKSPKEDLEIPNMNPEILEDLEKKDQVVYVSNKVYDDETILELAIRKNAVVISNDQFRDLKGVNPRFANYLKHNNTLDYVLKGDIFFCNPNPFGKGGPTLDEVLSMHRDNLESKIAPLSDDERPKKGSALKPDNKEKKDSGDKNKNENEIYLFIPDIKTNSESKIEMYFANLFGVKNIKMLFIEKKAAIALKSVPLSKYREFFEKHKKAVNEMPSLGDIELKHIEKTKEVLVKVNTKDLEKVESLINQIMSPEKFFFSAFDGTSKETSDLFVLTFQNVTCVNKWLNDGNGMIKSNSAILSNFGPFSKDIIELYKKSNKKDPKSTNKNDWDENNNLVIINHSYLYNYLERKKSKVIEEKFKVKLRFLGELRENGAFNRRSMSRNRSQLFVKDAESPSDCDSDESEVSNISNQSNQAANRRNNNNRHRAKKGRKLFRIAIKAELNKQFDQCKNYIETLNENFQLKTITFASEKISKHFEKLISRKIKEFNIDDENKSNNTNNDDNDELFDDIEMSYVKKFNKITVFLTSANEKNRKTIDEILKQLEIVSKEIGFKPTLTNFLKTKRVEFERSFNVEVYINYNKNTVEVHCLKLDEEDFKKVCESIENMEEENKLKMVTIRPSREEETVCKYLNIKELNEVYFKALGVFIEQDKRGFYLLKSKNQNDLNDAENAVKVMLDQIESQLEYECRKYPLNLFNFIKSSRWIKPIVGKHSVSMKIPLKLMKPVLSLVNKRAGDLRLFICNGNIVDANTSTIVNSANVNLANNGGVAKAIEDAAGQSYIEACGKLTKPLDANKVYVTTSGSIDCCQSIINVVAPVYSPELTKSDLIVKYLMCIDEALKNNYESIAFPLLGAGIFGWPIDLSLSALIECVNSYTTGFNRLKEVYLIESNPDSFREILDSIKSNLNKYINLSVEYNNFKQEQQQQKQPVIMRPPLMKLNTEQVETKWYWMDDSEQWKEYRSEIARELNLHKKKNESLFEMTIDNQQYKIDLKNKLQINTKTGYIRIILDEMPTESYAKWCWIEDGDRKQPYGQSDSIEIERAYKQKQPHLDLVIKRHKDDLDNQYRIDFGQMKQINMKSKYLRPIIREMCEVPVQVEKESIGDEDDENSQENELITYKIWFVGKRENLTTALREFDSKISALNYTDKIDEQNLNELHKNELKSNGFREKNNRNWIKNGVEIKQIGDSIELNGKLKRDVIQMKEELIRMFLKKKKIEYPSYWDLSKNKSDNFYELIDVGPTPERAQIEAEFEATLANNQIIGIKRIQNTRIYKYYYEEKNYLLKKSKKGMVNEMFLWHGTRNVAPSTVYSSDKCGLDFHHSNEGMWGRGIYLAKNASYSHSYSHTLQDGSKQLLFCSVLIGDSVKLVADNSLRLPPFKDRVSGSGERFDSVEGFTGDSQIFIVYENQKVYPAYLITYK